MRGVSSGPTEGAFSTRLCQNTSHLYHTFKQHANSNYHQHLEKKLVTNGFSVNLLTSVEKINLKFDSHLVIMKNAFYFILKALFDI